MSDDIGWVWPGASRKAHYFDSAGRSLCGKWAWMLGPDTTQPQTMTDVPGKDDCALCWRRAKARVALEQGRSGGQA